jgi:hypothetical protein
MNRAISLPPYLQRSWTYLKTLPKDAQWALRDINLTDDGLTIAQVICDGTALGMSDGSFKDDFGTASWVLEGSSPRHRIRGDNCPRRHGGSRLLSQRTLRLVRDYTGSITLGVYAPSANSTRLIKEPLRSRVTALPHWREDSMKHRTPRFQRNTLT